VAHEKKLKKKREAKKLAKALQPLPGLEVDAGGF
jgi:hypothetical protein